MVINAQLTSASISAAVLLKASEDLLVISGTNCSLIK